MSNLRPSRAQTIKQARRGIKWATLGELGPRLITPFTSILLAILLEPAAFGLVAIATAILMLARVVVVAGMRDVIVQRPEKDIEAAIDFVFTFSLLVSSLMYALLFLIAPPLENLYQMPMLSDVLRVTGLNVVILAMAAVPMGILQRQMRFNRLFIVRGAPQLVAAGVSVVWALAGGGVWALVLGPLFGNVANLILGWLFARHFYIPRLTIRFRAMLGVLSFSSWVVMANLLRWVYGQFDNIVAGLFFTATLTGYYTLSFNLTGMIPSLITSVFIQVAYPAFCNLQEDVPSVGRALTQLQTRIAAIVMPTAFGLSAVAQPLVAVVYGEKWLPMGDTMMIFALLPALINLWSLNGEAYRAIGKPHLWTQVYLVSILVVIPTIIFVGPLGLLAFTIVRAIGSLSTIIISFRLTRRHLFASYREQFDAIARPLLASLVMFLGVVGLRFTVLSDVNAANLLMLIGAGMVIYALTLYIIAPQLTRQIVASGWQTLRR